MSELLSMEQAMTEINRLTDKAAKLDKLCAELLCKNDNVCAKCADLTELSVAQLFFSLALCIVGKLFAKLALEPLTPGVAFTLYHLVPSPPGRSGGVILFISRPLLLALQIITRDLQGQTLLLRRC
jgi:hypothetical protein